MGFLIRLVINFFKVLPLNARYFIGHLITDLIYYIPTREKKVASLQLQRFLPNINHLRTLKKMYNSFGDTCIEAISANEILASNVIKIEDQESFKSVLNDPNPKLFLTGHVGNWELLAAWTAKELKFPLTVIGRSIENPSVQNELLKLRTAYGVQVLSKDDKLSAFKILRLLKGNNIVGALIDQDTDVESLMVPFFGVLSKTPSALITGAKKSGASIYTLFLVREEDRHFTVKIKRLNSQNTTFDLLCEYNTLLEKVIIKYPWQWVWVHKRWRSKEDGQVLRTNEYITDLQKQLYAK